MDCFPQGCWPGAVPDGEFSDSMSWPPQQHLLGCDSRRRTSAYEDRDPLKPTQQFLRTYRMERLMSHRTLLSPPLASAVRRSELIRTCPRRRIGSPAARCASTQFRERVGRIRYSLRSTREGFGRSIRPALRCIAGRLARPAPRPIDGSIKLLTTDSLVLSPTGRPFIEGDCTTTARRSDQMPCG